MIRLLATSLINNAEFVHKYVKIINVFTRGEKISKSIVVV